MTTHDFYQHAIIKAERFHDTRKIYDDDQEFTDKEFHDFVVKYNLIQPYGPFNIDFAIPTPYGNMRVVTGDWIVTDLYGEHWPVSDIIFRVAYKQLPITPDFVGDYIRRMHRKNVSLVTVMAACYQVNQFVEEPDEILTWINKNPDTFALAWLLNNQEVSGNAN